jgi:putative ABC transport system permease protein
VAREEMVLNGGIFTDALWQDLRYAIRQLLNARGFAIVVIATLALGIGANTAIFTLLNAWLLRPLPLKDPRQLVEVWRTQLRAPADPAYFDLYRDYLVWAAKNTTLQSLAATFEQSYTLTGAGEPRRVQGAAATWNLFSTVGGSAELGRLFVADDATAEPSCVISHSLWARQFNSSPDVLNRSIVLNGRLFRVVGVLPATFSLRVLDRTLETDVWTIITAGDANYGPNSKAAVAVIGRLEARITPAEAQANLSSIQNEVDKQSNDAIPDSGVLVVNLQADNTRTIRSSLLLLFGAVALLLVIACVNAGSLILGRNSQRAREFAVRVALGCGRSRLLQQLTTEVLVLFTAGGAFGLLIAWLFVRVFVAWSPFEVLPPGGISLDSSVFTMAACVVGVTALFFGSIPALRALRILDGGALRAGLASTAAPAQIRSRMMFVGAEISLSVILLVSAGLLISTFMKIGSEPLGFQTSNVFVTDVALPYSAYDTAVKQSRFGEELSRNVRKSGYPRGRSGALMAFQRKWSFTDRN